jgi:hypothetical protein
MFELTKFRHTQFFGHQELIEILNHEEKEEFDEQGNDFRQTILRKCRVVASCQSQIICVGMDLFMRSKNNFSCNNLFSVRKERHQEDNH